MLWLCGSCSTHSCMIILLFFILSSSPLSQFFFFLMIRRPPRSTLFPTRRSSDLCRAHRVELRKHGVHPANRVDRVPRSEEHTSELQSPDHLVCRLLLEKKKENSDTEHTQRISTATVASYRRRVDVCVYTTDVRDI